MSGISGGEGDPSRRCCFSGPADSGEKKKRINARTRIGVKVFFRRVEGAAVAVEISGRKEAAIAGVFWGRCHPRSWKW